MNKNMAGILSAAAVLTMLAGCTAYDRTKDQFVQPVVKDVKKGMSRAQVAQIAGKPSSEVSMIHARGTCQTYIEAAHEKRESVSNKIRKLKTFALQLRQLFYVCQFRLHLYVLKIFTSSRI